MYLKSVVKHVNVTTSKNHKNYISSEAKAIEDRLDRCNGFRFLTVLNIIGRFPTHDTATFNTLATVLVL